MMSIFDDVQCTLYILNIIVLLFSYCPRHNFIFLSSFQILQLSEKRRPCNSFFYCGMINYHSIVVDTINSVLILNCYILYSIYYIKCIVSNYLLLSILLLFKMCKMLLNWSIKIDNKTKLCF